MVKPKNFFQKGPLANYAEKLALFVFRKKDPFTRHRTRNSIIDISLKRFYENEIQSKFLPILGIAVPEAFRERVGCNLQLSDTVVLVSSDRNEFSLLKNNRPEALMLRMRLARLAAFGALWAHETKTLPTKQLTRIVVVQG